MIFDYDGILDFYGFPQFFGFGGVQGAAASVFLKSCHTVLSEQSVRVGLSDAEV